MKTALVVALIAGAVSLISAVGTVYSSMSIAAKTDENAKRIRELDLKVAREKELSTYSEPLIRSAYDLQSRLYNIINQGLVTVYLKNGIQREKDYVRDNTTFLVGQFLGATEVVRRDVSVVDVETNEEIKRRVKARDDLSAVWGTDLDSPILRIFAGEQRAIGEALIVEGPRGPECMGYGKFLTALKAGENTLIDAVRSDVDSLAVNAGTAAVRMKKVQNALIDLLLIFDPEYLRYPANRRTKA